MYKKHKELLVELQEKTDAGSLSWTTSSDVSDQFVLKLKKGTILFDKFTNPTRYKLSILNDEGAEIDSFWLFSNDEYFNFATQFFSSVYRKINRVDETIDALLGEINAPSSKKP